MNGTPRTHMLLVTLACFTPVALAAPAVAANPGGAAFPTGPGLHVATPSAPMVGDTVTFTGSLPDAPSKTIVVQRQEHSGLWTQTATTMSNATGDFTAQWQADHAGLFPVRALPAADVTPAALATVSTTNPLDDLATPLMAVYRPYIATWYGPGFFGQRMACGHILHRNTLGVANKTLPCGTQVALAFQGHTITVPVVDRGPYANHASWDLTAATAHALSMNATETIGAVSIPGSAPKATTTTKKKASSSGGASG